MTKSALRLTKTDYRKTRFGLATGLLNDGFFSYEINTNGRAPCACCRKYLCDLPTYQHCATILPRQKCLVAFTEPEAMSRTVGAPWQAIF